MARKSADPASFTFTRNIKEHGRDGHTLFKMECTVTKTDEEHIFFQPNRIVERVGGMEPPANLLEPATISRRAFDIMVANGGITNVVDA